MASVILTGCVKWFNHNLNYGFVTVLTEGENHNVDVFVHQSNIKTKNDCYRTLSPGECVQFEITKSENSTHPFHAVNVTGFNGGLLNCESSRPRNIVGGNSEERGNGYRGRGGGYRGRGGFRGGRDSGGRDSGGRDSGGRDSGGRDSGGRDISNDNYNNQRLNNRSFTRQPYVARSNSNVEEISNVSQINNESITENINETLSTLSSTQSTQVDIDSLTSTMATNTMTSKPKGRGRGRGKSLSS
jgi:cold shock CspA family protein